MTLLWWIYSLCYFLVLALFPVVFTSTPTSPEHFLTNICFVSPALRVSPWFTSAVYILNNHFSPQFLCSRIWNHIGVIPLFLPCVYFSPSLFLLSALFSFVGTASVARRSLAAPVDSAVLSRLLTPTQASLARSKSAAALSAEGGDTQGNPREEAQPVPKPSACV